MTISASTAAASRVIQLSLAFLIMAGSFQLIASAHPSHDPIAILSDAGFTHENGVVGGEGTMSHPYVIGGWVIESDQNGDRGVRIENTTAFFMIRHVSIDLAGLDGEGIRLYNATNGSVESCEIASCGHGIFILSCSNLTVKENTCAETVEQGVVIWDSSDVKFYHNNIFGRAGGVGHSCKNIWLNDVYPSGGNYWAVYRFAAVDEFRGRNQTDPGSDGFADSPFAESRSWYFVDNYPLMKPYSGSDQNSIIIPAAIALSVVAAVSIALVVVRKRPWRK